LPGFVAYVGSGITVPVGLTHLYYICFLSGLVISSAVYCMLHYVFPVSAIKDFVENAPPAKVLMCEYQERWDRGDQVETVLTETPKV